MVVSSEKCLITLNANLYHKEVYYPTKWPCTKQSSVLLNKRELLHFKVTYIIKYRCTHLGSFAVFKSFKSNSQSVGLVLLEQPWIAHREQALRIVA